MDFQTELTFKAFLRLPPQEKQDLREAINKYCHQPPTLREQFDEDAKAKANIGITPAKTLFDDLCAITGKLEHLLLPLQGLLGDHYLQEPPSQCWFPFRPGSIAEADLEEWGLEAGNWEDGWRELAWCDGGIGVTPYRPQLVFASPEGCLFDVFETDPLTNHHTLNITVDGLLYVRDNMARLLHIIQERINLLHTHGLVTDYPLLKAQLQQLAAEYQRAGAEHSFKASA